MSTNQDRQHYENKARVLTQRGNFHQHEACKNEAQRLSQKMEQLEKAANDRNDDDMYCHRHQTRNNKQQVTRPRVAY